MTDKEKVDKAMRLLIDTLDAIDRNHTLLVERVGALEEKFNRLTKYAETAQASPSEREKAEELDKKLGYGVHRRPEDPS